MSTINKRILDGGIRHMVWLERYKTGTVNKIIKLLNKADKDLTEQLAKRLAGIEERGYDLGAETTRRMKALNDALKAQRAELYKLAHKETREHLNDFSEHEADFQARLIETSIGSAAKVTLERPALSLLKATVEAKPFQGRILKDWFEDLSATSGKQINDAVSIGIAQGQTTDQIVRRIAGTRAAQYSDGVLEISRRNAAAVVRTSISAVANHAAEDLYAANADIIQGVQMVATLDGRTTPYCRAIDGKVFGINEGPRPPFHWGCRTRTVPYLGKTSIAGTRASAIGPVPGDVTYQDWLTGQGAAVQDEILGPTRGKLFRDGGLSLDRFVDQNGKQYTLDQLKARDAQAWDEAF